MTGPKLTKAQRLMLRNISASGEDGMIFFEAMLAPEEQALDFLVDCGFVRDRRGAYSITPAGRAALSEVPHG